MKRYKTGLSGARLRWYQEYRWMRIFAREMNKVMEDVFLHGSGASIFTNESDYIRHVPLENVIIKGENHETMD